MFGLVERNAHTSATGFRILLLTIGFLSVHLKYVQKLSKYSISVFFTVCHKCEMICETNLIQQL